MIILYGLFVDYGWDGTPVSFRGRLVERTPEPVEAPVANAIGSIHAATAKQRQLTTGQDLTKAKTPAEHYYSMFQDVHVMIFIGFGFLMTFMRQYGYGGVGFNYIVAVVVIQWSILVRGFFEMPENDYRIRLDITKLISGDFTAGTVLITLGVVLGKLSPVQYIVMVVIETVLAVVNEWIVLTILRAADVGGTITIHLFGAFFGLALARTIHMKEWSDDQFNNLKFGSVYNDLFSMVGTLFLFMYWPSFNAAVAVGDGRYRAIYNTYLAIASSCVAAYMMSWVVKSGKFSMDIVQNATLAGGVVVGSICDMFLYPWGALVCGFGAGIVSALGFHYLSPFLDQKWGVHDTCGVNNLHAMPALLGSFLSAIVAACASPAIYGSSYYDIFPALAPVAGSEEYTRLKALMPDLEAGAGRTPTGQAANQLAALITTLGVAIVGGIITGAFLRIPIWHPLNIESVFDDSSYWMTPQHVTPHDEDTLRSSLGGNKARRPSRIRNFPVIAPARPGTDFVVRTMMTSNSDSQTDFGLSNLSLPGAGGPRGRRRDSFYANYDSNNVSL
ncbi:Ammonium transporter Rh type C [Hypsibius exemplaris]|uniref:Ammonium transporter Rh type C n=1 Tax=Hypsibius exemplaris TaxID=2072580 RepID=A0A1W0WPU5_HYPEX|nr:Ammonium transporter Rh type C [Hypsibius exemplaris]